MSKLEDNLFELIHAAIEFKKKTIFTETCNKLNPAELNLFDILKPDIKITMTELAMMSSTSKGASTLLVDKLVRKNLVKRSYKDDDRRVVYVSLSKGGIEIYNDYVLCKARVFGSMSKTFKGLDLNVCNKFLELLIAELKKTRKNKTDLF